MSYTIEYNRKVYFWDNEYNETNFLLLIRQGDNNVRESDTGLREKEWNLEASGWESNLWERICKRAGATAGGNIQRAKGYDTESFSIENYIALYRKAIKNAKPISNLLNEFGIEFYISKDVRATDSFALEKLSAALAKYADKFKAEEDSYTPSTTNFFMPITTLEDFLWCLQNVPSGKYVYPRFYFNKVKRINL